MKNLYRIEIETIAVVYIRDSDSFGKALKSALRAAKRNAALYDDYKIKIYVFDETENKYILRNQYIQMLKLQLQVQRFV